MSLFLSNFSALRRCRALTVRSTVQTGRTTATRCSPSEERGLHSEVSRLCRGLPGHGGRLAELDGIRPALEASLCSGVITSMALLFWLGEGWSGGSLDSPVSGGGIMMEIRLVGASSSPSFSSIRGIWGSESSIRNSGWLMKLWMELRASGVSRPS